MVDADCRVVITNDFNSYLLERFALAGAARNLMLISGDLIPPLATRTINQMLGRKVDYRYGTLRAPPTTTPPKPAEATLGFSSTRKTIDNSPGWRYSSDQKKGLFKFPIRKVPPLPNTDDRHTNA